MLIQSQGSTTRTGAPAARPKLWAGERRCLCNQEAASRYGSLGPCVPDGDSLPTGNLCEAGRVI